MRGENFGTCNVVIGIGRICRMPERAGTGIEQPWTDVESALGRSASRNALAAHLLTLCVRVLHAFQHAGLAPFLTEWQQYDAARGKNDSLRLTTEIITCIVDAGTAITLDDLSTDGHHLGGLIMPGIELMRRSLLERSEGIRAATASPERGDITLLARDTQSGVDGGTLYAAVAAIDRVMQDVGTELGETLTRVITGGDAERLLTLLHGQYHHVPDLVLHGLAIIAEAV